ncbi:protein spindle-F [Thrips palmi]|uniref:Protein spindle-F n=1 Tax=Thrips palmi TaxID=161013 RepID=A0A6P8ZRE7_THRPL|nr:protein spindle-F [Thrips palmi]
MAESESQVMPNLSNQDIIGSRYALEVAFQTMKERCQRLQQRLAKVEDENSKLRLQRRKDEVVVGSRAGDEPEAMRDKIAELERQKQQLAQHVFMVTSENKQLWTRLSQSAKLNQSLGSQLTKISDSLNRHSASTNLSQSQLGGSMMASSSRDILRNSAVLSQFPKNKEVLSSAMTASDSRTDSLEEISLKLINSFLQEKSELEDQCAQMTELREGGLSPTFSADHLGFSMTSTNGSAGEDADLMDPLFVPEVQQLRDSLLSIKQDLLMQQENMRVAVTNLLKFRDGGLKCQACTERAKTATSKASEEASRMSTATTTRFESANIAEPESLGDSADEEIKEQLQRVPENSTNSDHSHPAQNARVCPICGRFYPSSVSFGDFHRHVVNHFEDEEEKNSFLLV